MFIFKRKRGEAESRDWYCRFNDCMGTQREVKLFGDKKASEQAGANLERLRDFRQAGRAFDSGLLVFVEAQSMEMRIKLAAWGLLDAMQVAASMPLMTIKAVKSRNGKPAFSITGGILSDYIISLQNRECTKKHTTLIGDHCRHIIQGCKFIYTSDITTTKVKSFLQTLRQQGRSARTANSYAAGFKSFCEWMTTTGILSANPCRMLENLNASADRRLIRRALTEIEIPALLSAAEKGEFHHGLTGHERTLIYRVALESGLRWNEIYTQRRNNFHLESNYVTIGAKNAKNGKADMLPISVGLVADLHAYFIAHPALPLAKAFAGMWSGRGGNMLAIDLNAAGIAVENEAEDVVDFHSLRHTCGTRLAKAGVSPQVAQRIMRHSSMELTLKYYTHLTLEDKASALAKLPEILPAVSNIMTGTNKTLENTDTPADTTGCPFSVHKSHRVSLLEKNRAGKSGGEKTATPELTAGCGFEYLEPPAGFEPATCGLQNRCSTN